MEESWGEVVKQLAEHFGWGWVVAGGVTYLVVSRLDSVKRLIVGRRRTQNIEREQNWDDAQDIIRNLQEEADRLRRWRDEDARAHERVVENLRQQLTTALETISSEQRGNSRLRHALNNVLFAYSAMREIYRKHGLQPPPFKEMGSLLELGYSTDDIFTGDTKDDSDSNPS